MILYVLRRMRRRTAPVLGVLLFAAILSAVLCGVQKANDKELEKYYKTYHTIPVQFSVTSISGNVSTNLGIGSQVAEVFTREDCLAKYVSDLQRICRHPIQSGSAFDSKLEGITSFALSPELWPENGAMIEWKEGYDEAVFSQHQFVCVIPYGAVVQTEETTGENFVELHFEHWYRDIKTEYVCRMKVVGTYRGGDGKTIYCPYIVCEQVYTELGETITVQAIRATLKNNDDLEELRTVSKQWFPAPNPLGEATPYEGKEWGYDYYPFALSINDDLLQRASATLQTSITTNRVCTMIVLVLSAAAGFLIGFLMLRNRKKEIALMRTMGTSNQSIYAGFALEQMLCVVLGIALGGAYNRWHPAERLGILATAYFVGLTIALLIFLRKNLLTTIKEDE